MSQTEVQLIKDAVIVNADVSNSAAIDVSKISGALPAAGGTITGDVTFDGETAGRDIVFDRSENSLEFADNAFIKFGTGGDLQIYHDSADSYLNNSTGTLYARGDTISLNAMSTTDKYFDATNGGAANLYHDNSKKFETTSAGGQLSGSALTLEDSSGTVISFDESGTRKAFIGIRSFAAHDGNGIMIQTSETAPIKFAINNVVKAVLDNNGDFKPGTNNANDLGTSSVRWGDLYLADDLHMADAGVLKMGDSADLLIQHTGANNFIEGGSSFSGNLYVRAKLNENGIVLISDGAVEIYHDNVKKIETGTNYNFVYAVSNGNPAGLKIRNVDANSNYSHAELRLESKNAASYGSIFNDHQNGCVRIGHNTTGNTLEIFSDGVIRMQGIKFGSDISDNNKLDDYEEGTYTITALNDGGATLTSNRANYTKIGNMVRLSGSFTITATNGTNNNQARFSIPFTSSINGFYVAHGNTVTSTGYTGVVLSATIENAGPYMIFNPAVGMAARSWSQLGNNRFDFDLVYRV